MKKYLLAATLAAFSVPSQAAIVFELKGKANFANFDVNVSPNPISAGGADVVLSGYCWLWCNSNITENGFSFQITQVGIQGFSGAFTFSEPDATPLGTDWHTGTGSASGFFGSYQGTHVVLKFTEARVYDDGKPGPNNASFLQPTYTNQFTYGVPEPTTWALMIAGFGLTGAALRRRRHSVAFA